MEINEMSKALQSLRKLEGHLAIRTKPITQQILSDALFGSATETYINRAFMDNPIYIIHVTNSHIVYASSITPDYTNIKRTDLSTLSDEFIDENWILYDDIIDEAMKKVNNQIICPTSNFQQQMNQSPDKAIIDGFLKDANLADKNLKSDAHNRSELHYLKSKGLKNLDTQGLQRILDSFSKYSASELADIYGIKLNSVYQFKANVIKKLNKLTK
jgi:hypothetical protein